LEGGPTNKSEKPRTTRREGPEQTYKDGSCEKRGRKRIGGLAHIVPTWEKTGMA